MSTRRCKASSQYSQLHPYLNWPGIDWAIVFLTSLPSGKKTAGEPKSEHTVLANGATYRPLFPPPRVVPPAGSPPAVTAGSAPGRQAGVKRGSASELDRSAARLIRHRLEAAENWVTIDLMQWMRLLRAVCPEINWDKDDRDEGAILPEIEPELPDDMGLVPHASPGNNVKMPATIAGELAPRPKKIKIQGPDCLVNCQPDGTPYENTGRSYRRYEQYDQDGNRTGYIEECGKAGRMASPQK